LAAVKRMSKNLPPWMMAMQTHEVECPIGLAANVAWQELILREKKLKEIASVKGAVEALTTDKVLIYDSKNIQVQHANGSKEAVLNHAGHLIRESKTKEVEMNSLIAAENIVDAMMFPVQKYDSTKRAFELSDRAQVGQMQFPEFPVEDFMTAFKIQDPAQLRLKFMKDAATNGVDAFFSKVSQYFPERMKPVGCGGFSVSKPMVYVSEGGNIAQMYKQISASRKLRGNDNDMNSVLTRGYYYGYMSAPMYRTFHTVSDVLRVMRATGIYVLRIARQSGLFNSAVVSSLVANGVYIHSEADTHLDECDLTLEGVTLRKPGIYRRVITKKNVMRYFELNDRYPEFKDGVIYHHPVLERLKELSTNTNIKHFSILYLRDELRDCTHHLIPSAHAHSGQVIWFQDELQEPLDINDYVKRVVAATSYKCYAAYCRAPWILKDPYVYTEPFRITQKALKNFLEFEAQDCALDEGFIAQFEYDVQLGALSPSVKEAYLAMASQDKEKIEDMVKKKEITYVTEYMKEGEKDKLPPPTVNDGFNTTTEIEF